MLKAKEAVEMTLASTKNVNEMIDKIEQQIILSAKDGGRSINLSKLFHQEFPSFALEEFDKSPRLTKFQERVKSILQENGYGFTIRSDQCDVNHTLGSMADDEDAPRLIFNNWIEVRW